MNANVYLEEQEYIALCDLLKISRFSGKVVDKPKNAIASGKVLRNGKVEIRKTAKIRGGDVIEFSNVILEVCDGYDPED